jgi:RND family efflux transporter MFP subunit
MNLRCSTAGILAAGLLLSGAGCRRDLAAANAQGAKAAEPVPVIQPVRQTLRRYSVQPGQVQAFAAAPLHPRISGYVDAVLVDIGDRVEQGQPLARVDAPEVVDELRQREALVAQAQAAIGQSEADLEAAKAAAATAAAEILRAEAGIDSSEADLARYASEHDRIESLAKGGSVTEKLVDEARNRRSAAEAAKRASDAALEAARAKVREQEAKVDQAQADLVAASANLGVAEANRDQTKTLLSFADIKAPFTGVVTRRHVDPGHLVRAAQGATGKPLFELASIDKVRVFCDVPEREAAAVDAGDAAIVRAAGREFPGTISRTSWALDELNRSLRAEIDLDNREGLLRPGTYVTVAVELEARPDVLTLPPAAVFTAGGQEFVSCCVVDERVERRPVKVGMRTAEAVEVQSGLSERDWLVAATPAAFSPGQTIRPERRPSPEPGKR